MKPIPLEALERLLGPNAETSSAESASTVPEEKPSGASVSKYPTYTIVDTTEQRVGQSLIITGVRPPKE